jgi:hypothetical protein
MANRQFIINVDGVYYLTTGRVLEFDADKAKGNQQKVDGVEEVRKKFEATSASARYSAVEVKDADFAGIMSSES